MMRHAVLCFALVATPVPILAHPLAEVARANGVARVQPRREAYANAAQVFVFSDAALYQVYAAPGRITDIALQPGEQLVGEGALAAGDTVRWVIADTVSGEGDARRVHVLLKPVAAGLRTNLIINTDRRTYHLELQATTGPFLAAVRWRYPLDESRAAVMAQAAHAEALRAVAASVVEAAPEPAALNFGYRLEGRARWRPVRVYDDGRRTIIEFPASVARDELPPLFLHGPDGALEIVNFRVRGQTLIVDRVFDVAELRLQRGRVRTAVTIRRVGAAP